MRLLNKRLLDSVTTFPEFTSFSDLDEAEFRDFMAAYEPYSDYNYTSLFAWRRSDDHHVAALNGNIVLSMKDYMSDKWVLSFIGDTDVDETAHTLLLYARISEQYENELYLIPHQTVQYINNPHIVVAEDIDNNDYLLSPELFMTLEGPGFSHTRRKLSQFSRSYGEHRIETKPVDLSLDEHHASIRMLATKWAFMGTEGSVTAHEEIAAIERLLTHIDTLNTKNTIHCLGMFVDDELEGFCIYELCDDYAIVHFIKSNLAYIGSADYVMVATMRRIFDEHKITLVNHEQDLGIGGLRSAKLRYCPTGYLYKYRVALV